MATNSSSSGSLSARELEGPSHDVLASDIDGRLVVPATAPIAGRESTSDPLARWLTRDRRPAWPYGWQIAAAVAGWPLWWAAGLTQFVFPVLGVYLGWTLARRGGIRVPDGFWIWALFLFLVLLSGFAIDVEAVGTQTTSGIGRYLAYGFRFLNYLAITLMMLYVGNATEDQLPRRRVIRWISFLGVATIGFGLLAVALPNLSFPTLFSFLAPSSLLGDDGSVAKLAQVQPVLGVSLPRPSAPFAFTNAWGNNLSLLLVWLVVGWTTVGSRRQRLWLWPLLVVAAIPIAYSLNRGMWLGLGIAVLVVGVRLAIKGRVAVLYSILGLISVGAIAFALSPLQAMVQARLEAGHSNELRGSLAKDSIVIASTSPLIGFGSTRETLGSEASIAIAPTASCPNCGERDVGSTGQLTLLLIAQGFLGAALYLAFLGRSLWAYRGDWSVIGIAGTLVVLLELFYAGFYSALSMPLAITMLSIGLLWRNQQIRRAAQEAAS